MRDVEHGRSGGANLMDKLVSVHPTPSPVESECEHRRPFSVTVGHPDSSTLCPTLGQSEERDAPRVVEEHDGIGSFREEIDGRTDASFRDPFLAAEGVSDQSA